MGGEREERRQKEGSAVCFLELNEIPQFVSLIIKSSEFSFFFFFFLVDSIDLLFHNVGC